MISEDENSLSESDIRFNPPLYIQRYQKAFNILDQNNDIRRIADFGCAEGKFIRRLKKLVNAEEIVCIDQNDYSLELCIQEARPLAWDAIFGRPKPLIISVMKGNVGQKDRLLKDFDAITCIELIEHLNSDVLTQLVENIFSFIRPKLVIITTPNADFNVLFPELNGSSKLRHWDHKFEWTRHQFQEWCQSIINTYNGYSFETTGVGEPPIRFKDIGFCTQIAIFSKNEEFISKSDDKEYMNYRLIERFHIQKSDRTERDEPIIDWESVLN